MSGVEVACYARDGGGSLRSTGRAGAEREGQRRGSEMRLKGFRDGLKVVELNPKRFAPVEVVQEGGVGLLGLFGVFLCKIHKIRAMWDDMARKGIRG